jgi:hypothetical protein
VEAVRLASSRPARGFFSPCSATKVVRSKAKPSATGSRSSRASGHHNPANAYPRDGRTSGGVRRLAAARAGSTSQHHAERASAASRRPHRRGPVREQRARGRPTLLRDVARHAAPPRRARRNALREQPAGRGRPLDHLNLPSGQFPVDEPQNLAYLRQHRFTLSKFADPKVVPYDVPAAIRGKTPDERSCPSSSASFPTPPAWTTKRGTRSSRRHRPTAGTSTTSGSGTSCSKQSGRRGIRSSATAWATARWWPTSTASRRWRRRWRTSSVPRRRSTGSCGTATRRCPRSSFAGSRRRAEPFTSTANCA